MPSDDESLRRFEALERKVALLERELAASRMSNRRASVQQALLEDRLLILERNRLFRWWGHAYRAAARLYSRVNPHKSQAGLSDLRTPEDYARWVSHQQNQLEAEDHHGTMAQWRWRPSISVLMKADATTQDADFRNSIQSLLDQCYANWELCLAGSSTVKDEIQRGPAASHTRIVDDPTPETATGDFVLVLHPGDRLSPHALYFYAQALQRPDNSAELLYADEDRIDAGGVRTEPLFKPAWSPELLSSTMYLGRAVLYRRDVFQDYEKCNRVLHIPRVLYHRAGAANQPLPRRIPRYGAPPGSRISLIVCSRNVAQVRECLEAVKATATLPLEILLVHHLESGTGEEIKRLAAGFSCIRIPYRGPFDFARMNNLAASRATASYLLFLNDDVMVRQPGWDQALAATLARPEIGVAGAILQYPDETIQHAGVVIGMGDAVGHCGRFQKTSDLWPWLRMSRDVSAVTGAMLAIRSELFRNLGGFDETFPVNYNDVDLCFRVREAGLRIVCLDLGEVIHREAQTRIAGTRYEEREALYKRWAGILARPDEFYSPHLAPTERIALNNQIDSPLKGLCDKGLV